MNTETGDAPPSRRSYLKAIEVDKLWMTKDVSVSFEHDVNILVGHNGSGKTTILNMIADILLLDFDALAKLSFSAIRLYFFNPLTGLSPRLAIERLKSSNNEVDQGLNIQAFSDFSHSIPAVEQSISFQYRPSNRIAPLSGLFPQASRSLEPIKPSLAAFINELASVTWISVHRKAPTPTNQLQTNFDSSVDERLEQINVKFTEFVNELDGRLAKETDEFQKHLLKSLMLTLPSPNLSRTRIKKMKVNRLRDSVSQMLYDLKMLEQLHLVEEIFSKAGTSISNIMSGKETALKDLLNASYMLQMEKIVDSWSKYNEKTSEINRTKYAVVLRLDDFITDKEAFIGANGRVYFHRKPVVFKNPKKIYILPNQLSSGEKQIYILLMETLLSSGRPSIFIADEPELSLHVLWQEKLVDTMRRLNQDAQLIFATHSPDIIGNYSNNVRDMDREGINYVSGAK